MKTTKIKERSDLVRDSKTHAVLNVDKTRLLNAKIAKKARTDRMNEIASLKQDISELRDIVNNLIKNIKDK